MKTRMQPIDNVWSKLPRVVRDLSPHLRQAGPRRDGGQGDRARPHHPRGDQGPAHPPRPQRRRPRHRDARGARRARASPPRGACCCAPSTRAARSTSRSPTTAGASTRRVIGAKAVERGLVTAEQLGRMTDARDRRTSSSCPGFSTAAAVTNVSRPRRRHGRRQDQHREDRRHDRRAEPRRPRHDVPHQDPADAGDHPGADGDLRRRPLRHPAGQPARAGAPRGRGRAPSGIEQIHGAPVYRLRGQPAAARLPRPRARPSARASSTGTRDTLFIVVLQAEDRQFGLVVDDVIDTEEIVVKPLGKQLKGIPSFAGATILGDGTRRAHPRRARPRPAVQRPRRRPRPRRRRPQRPRRRRAGQGRVAARRRPRRGPAHGHPAGDGHPARGVPGRRPIEHVGRHEVVQYRGQILPLVRLAALPRRRQLRRAAPTPCRSSSTARTTAASASSSSRSSTSSRRSSPPAATSTSTACVGSAVVQEHITELLDVRQAILAADPHFYLSAAADLAEV